MNIWRLAGELLFVFAVVFIWLMLLYQFVLTVGGFFVWRRSRGKNPEGGEDEELPSVSVLVPARNEEKVIGDLIRSLQAMRYPKEKLEIVIIDDGSRDRTGEIVRRASESDGRIRLVEIPPGEAGRGKGYALNAGLGKSRHEIIAVYDADNRPEPDSLRRLCRALLRDPRAAAVTGKFRAYNRGINLLTRMIDLETLAFQWIIQAGRWFFLKIAFLSGTNFVIRRGVLEEAGGWEESSLVEDAELTFRIYAKGWTVRFLPSSVTWEQEPERLAVWIRQRTRWARGNGHIIRKYGRRLFRARPRATALELLNLMFLYYLFSFAILVSDVIFFLSVAGVVRIRLPGPYRELWGLAFLLFLLEVMVAVAYEGEDSPSAFLTALLAYLTYTKLWVYVVLRSFYQEFVQRRAVVWDKTERFDLSRKEFIAKRAREPGPSPDEELE